MNKKFSTLMAVLLTAGAWTTLDAEVVVVDAPAIGKSYVLGTAASGNSVTDLVESVTTPTTTNVLAFGKEWTFEADGTVGGVSVFNLRDAAGNYLLEEGSDPGKLELGSTPAVDKANALKFKLDGNEIVVAEDGAAGKVLTGEYLIVDTDLKTGASATNVITIANQAEPTLDLTAIGQEVSLVASPEFGKDVYYFIGSNAGNVLFYNDGTGKTEDKVAASLTSAEVDAALWKVVKTTKTVGNDKVDYYQFVNKAKSVTAAIGVTSEFYANTAYAKGFTLFISAGVPVDGAFDAGSTGDEATFGIYKATLNALVGEELNKLLRTGFNLTVKVTATGSETLKDAAAFAGKLTAVQNTNGDDLTGSETEFCLMSSDKFLVLNTKKANGDNGDGVFELVDNVTADHLAYFSVLQSTAYTSTAVVAELHVAADASMNNAKTAIVHKINSDYYLTAKDNFGTGDALPYLSLTSSNIADYKQFLGKFMNITFVSDETETASDIAYKKNGVLATADYTGKEADYVNKSTVLLTSPEAQWAVTAVDVNKANNPMTLTNRESGETVTNVILRETTVSNEYLVESASVTNMKDDIIKIAFVTNRTKYDGFRTATVNELRNQVFNIGQYHNETGNTAGYWAENHQSNGTHQLGVTNNIANAAEWTLRLDKKLKSGSEISEVDTVFILTPMATIQNGKLVQGNVGDKDVVVDTLAVLPYQIQNKANLEYVRLESATNLDYYVCHEVADTRVEDRFALKAKPNGTYNIVTLPNRQNNVSQDALAADKIYVGNSNQWGSLKPTETYKADDNSLMVLNLIDRPEYRKVAKAWGDVVKIYREEYPTEVLFEKADVKSVVDNDTLSFLNVNNSVTGANPALFIDTAYVNRVDADGIANTCYQYLLGLSVKEETTTHCDYNPEHNTPEWLEANGGPCSDAKSFTALKGRYLINLIDTAYAYKQEHMHNNPYINMIEADENLAKLSFVEGYHKDDTLYITRKGGEVVKLGMDSPDFNVAKFAFRYVDNDANSFKIQTQYKDYSAPTKDLFEKSATNEGYLRWVNGTVVVTNKFTHGETFNMEEAYNGNPVANEQEPSVTTFTVISGNGSVTIKGAAGKTAVISNVLGQTVASTVLSSDEAQINVPAGVVVVAVEGEAAVKAIVK